MYSNLVSSNLGSRRVDDDVLPCINSIKMYNLVSMIAARWYIGMPSACYAGSNPQYNLQYFTIICLKNIVDKKTTPFVVVYIV